MATEQNLYRILAQFDPGNSPAEVARLFNLINAEIQKLAGRQLQVGSINPAELQKVQRQIAEAIKAGANSSDAFKGLDSKLRESMLGASGQFGKFLTEQAAVFSRTIEQGLAAAQARAAYNKSGTAYVTNKDLGITADPGKRLFPVKAFESGADKSTVNEARLRADKALADATGRYNAAVGRLNAAIEKEAQAHLDAAAKAARATRREEESRGRGTVALERRRQSDERIHRREQEARGRGILALERRRALDEAAAANQARLIEADRTAARQNVTYANPNTATGLGRAQAAVNAAEVRLFTANERLTELRQSETRTAAQLVAAQQQLRSATSALASAQERVRVASAAPPAGLIDQFRYGFKGAQDVPYAQQFGQAAKFSLLYGTAYKTLFAFTQTLQQTLQEGIEFQTAVSELKLATGQSRQAATDLANLLGEIAVNAGFGPAEGALAGARAIGLYGATESDPSTQRYVAELSTRVGSQLAFSSGMKFEDIQTRLAAITNAFQLGVAGQQRVADLDAYLGRRFGVAPGATIRTVAEAGSVGQQAGFSLEQTNAIAALLMGRTGQSDSAVAGWMAQIFSRGGEGSLQALTQRYGIDSEQTLANQLSELSRIYQDASPNERTEIASAFGRGKVQNAITVLLGSFDEITEAANDAASGLAEGASQNSFNERINNIGGQLQLLLADFKEFASQLGQSGVLAVLGVAVEVLDQFLESTTELLKVWNQMPGVVRAALASLALLAVVGRTSAGASLASAALGGATFSRLSTGGAYRGTLVQRGSQAGTGLAGARIAAGGFLATAGPWIAAAAGLIALGELTGAIGGLNKAAQAATDALNATTADLETPEQYRASAQEIRAAGEAAQPRGFWQNVVALGSSRADRIEDRNDREADRREGVADALAEQAKATADKATKGLIEGLDSQTLSASLDAITQSGGTANERFAALRDTLLGTAEAAGRAKDAFDPKVFAGESAQPLSKAIGESFPDIGTQIFKGKYGIDTSQLGASDPTSVQQALERLIGEMGIDSENLDLAQMRELSARLVDDTVLKSVADENGQVPQALQGFRTTLIDAVYRTLFDQTADIRNLLDENKQLTAAEITNGIRGLLQETESKLQLLPESDLAGRSGVLRAGLRRIRQSIAKQQSLGGEVTPQALADLATAQRQLAANEFERLEQLRQVAQQNAGSRAEAAAIGRQYLVKEAKTAVRLGDPDTLAKIVSATGQAGLRIVRRIIQLQIEQVRRALTVAQAIAAINPLAGIAGVAGYGTKLGGLEDMLNSVNSTPTDGSKGIGGYATDFPGYEPPEKGKSAADRKAEAEERRRRALAIRSSLRLLAIDLSNPLAEARVAVADALDQLKNAVDREARLAARVDLRRARINLEATKFQQRLEAVQTAEELGRISHLKYINYLESEKRRLESIKKRTFQQQQQLDEVERLLKGAADSMQGQWNFGDIKLPTPYEVRRRVQEVYGGGATGDKSAGYGGVAGSPNDYLAGSRVTTPQTVQININGADVQKVRQVVSEYIGTTTTTRGTTPRYR